MRSHGWLILILVAQACGLDHDHAPDASTPSVDAFVDDAFVPADAAGCVPLSSDVTGSFALGGWTTVQDPSDVADRYAELFTGTLHRDFFVPVSVHAVDGTHLELEALVASDYADCGGPDGYADDCSTFPTAARAHYAIRLDPVLPTATLLRAEVTTRGPTRDAFVAIAGALARYPSCDVLSGWDVWTVPSDARNGPVSGTYYFYDPPSFASVVLVERATGHAWSLALPTLPGACADAWAGVESGPDCVPSMGFPIDPASSAPHTLAFAAAPIGRPSAPREHSCALEAMCAGACPGCVMHRFYTGPPCATDLAWTRTLCAARTLDAIPTPAMPHVCAEPCDYHQDAGL